jgi:hypothetical protein
MEKICRKCKVIKPLDDYYIHIMMADGHLNICKECVKKQVRDRSHTPEGRAYDHARNQTPHRKAWLMKQQQKRRKKYKEITKCRAAFSVAIRSGKLVKQPCQVCGAMEVHGHHANYSKPLEVMWLCPEHHRELHKQYLRKEPF